MAIAEGSNAGFVTATPADEDPNETATDVEYRGNAVKYTSPSDMDYVTEIGWYCGDITGGENYWDISIYAHDAGNNKPNARIGSSGTVTITATGWAKKTSLNIPLNPSTIYWISVNTQATGGVTSMDTVSNGSYVNKIKLGNNTDPWGTVDSSGTRISAAYAKYTAIVSGASAIMTTNRGHW